VFFVEIPPRNIEPHRVFLENGKKITFVTIVITLSIQWVEGKLFTEGIGFRPSVVGNTGFFAGWKLIEQDLVQAQLQAEKFGCRKYKLRRYIPENVAICFN
jgi:hypothetical protein